jgi:hypothetical protein
MHPSIFLATYWHIIWNLEKKSQILAIRKPKKHFCSAIMRKKNRQKFFNAWFRYLSANILELVCRNF